MEVEIGRGKKARRAYASMTSRSCPRVARETPMTSTSHGRSATTASSCRCLRARWTRRLAGHGGAIGRLGGLAVLNLEGVFTRYEDADEQLERIALLSKEIGDARDQEIYLEPVKRS